MHGHSIGVDVMQLLDLRSSEVGLLGLFNSVEMSSPRCLGVPRLLIGFPCTLLLTELMVFLIDVGQVL